MTPEAAAIAADQSARAATGTNISSAAVFRDPPPRCVPVAPRPTAGPFVFGMACTVGYVRSSVSAHGGPVDSWRLGSARYSRP